jgi:hypothetical protein
MTSSFRFVASEPSGASDRQMNAYWDAAQRQPAKDLGFLQPRCYLAQFLVHHDEFDNKIGADARQAVRSWLAAARGSCLPKLSTRQTMHSGLR